MDKGIVLVTGASGYIAGFVIKQLLSEGWQVRGTIRNLGKADATRAQLGVSPNELPLFAADLSSDAGWDEAVAGCTHVAHIASPLPSGTPKNDDELIVPARDGALRALRAAKSAGVGRFVMTSSTAAVAYGVDEMDRTFTEADWSNPAHPDNYAYTRSKTIAERAARDWVAADGGGMEYCSVNPGAVIGPVMGSDFSTSIEVVKTLLSGSVPGVPRIGFPVVDVRDIADLHVRALSSESSMAGERFLGAGEFLWMGDVAALLKARLGARARKVPTLKLPGFAVRLTALFDPLVRTVVPELNRARRTDSSHAEQVLGWRMRPAAESVVDCAESLIAHGVVKV